MAALFKDVSEIILTKLQLLYKVFLLNPQNILNINYLN